ncbi:hypothetical protein FSP39_016982 [Pinctada imbricata]|uniref:N-acetylgalactosaminide beta-1,3-galactosyltransferase n=1 Tax=Pinctada imbricata TaxID=66713 RepID=A0AA88YIV7_PINIB|nr:hypothetical protein FSP39_016982 [Pinctada imbricata]
MDMGRVRIVNSTWARRCNKVFYITCPSEHHKDFINTCMFQETKETLLNKITYALFHVYKYYLQEFDWILKADDDTYVVMENLRFMLTSHSSNEPGYIGYHFRAHLTHGYHSGGAGFVISRKGLDQMMTQGYERGLCTITGEVEDMEIGKCLQIAGVPVLSSLDKFDRQTFHPEDFVRHITGSYPAWLVRWAREDMAGGTECCSQFVISFHHLDIYSTIVLHQLLYRTSVYGIRTPENIPGMFPVRKIHPLKPQTILFRATPSVLNPGEGDLAIECRLDKAGTGVERVSTITITRQFNYKESFFVFAGWNQAGEVRPQIDSVSARISQFDGNIGEPEVSFVRVKLETTDCTDVTTYRCEIEARLINQSRLTQLQSTIQVTANIPVVGIMTITASRSNGDVSDPPDSVSNDAFSIGRGNYTIGTAIYISCNVDAGNPGPASVTLCHKLKNESTYRAFVGTASKITFMGETPENLCRLRQSFPRNYIVRSQDMVGRNFFCEIPNVTSTNCTLVPSIASIFNVTAVSLPGVSIPVCTTVLPTNSSANQNADISGEQLMSLQTAANEVGVAFLIVGIIFIALSIPSVVFGVVSFLRMKKLKKEIELKMTRSTYDALSFQTQIGQSGGGLTYEALDNNRSEVTRQDSSGYMLPTEVKR